MLEQAFVSLERELTISANQIQTVASTFQEHMKLGLRGSTSSLKMFPSYLGAPRGEESGTFLALDFGGTNARAAVVVLKGQGNYEEPYKVSKPLWDAKSGRDLRKESATAEELFDFFAGIIQEVLRQIPVHSNTYSHLAGSLPLGFTFSFPYHQQKIGEGVLLNWDKEVKTSGVVGKDVGHLLFDALARQGLHGVARPTAIINDTVATYLAAAYSDPSIHLASIIGTGYNTCYLEADVSNSNYPMLINTESGNFSSAPETFYDYVLDQQSQNPGEQLLEKKLSGKYLGELLRIIIHDFSQRGLLNPILPLRWHTPYAISGKDLALILTKESDPDLNFGTKSRSEGLILQRIAHLLINRSARLAAASLIGIIQHLDPHFNSPHTIAIDGALYEKMPGYAQALSAALNEGLGRKAGLLKVQLSSGGSLAGAAIAAATYLSIS